MKCLGNLDRSNDSMVARYSRYCASNFTGADFSCPDNPTGLLHPAQTRQAVTRLDRTPFRLDEARATDRMPAWLADLLLFPTRGAHAPRSTRLYL